MPRRLYGWGVFWCWSLPRFALNRACNQIELAYAGRGQRKRR